MGLAHSSTKSKDEVNPANPVFEQKKMSGISLVNEKELVEATLKFDVPLNLDGILKKSCCEFELSCSETPGQYWVRDKPSSESEFEKIAFLKTVCWLQLNGEFEGVPAGKYIAYLRANFHSNNFSLNYRVGFGYRDVLHACDVGPDQSKGENEAVIHTRNGEMLPNELLQCCSVQSSASPCTSLKFSFFHDCDAHGFDMLHSFSFAAGHSFPSGFTYLMIGMFVVPEQGKVYVQMKGGNPNWTGNISFDHVGLIPVDDKGTKQFVATASNEKNRTPRINAIELQVEEFADPIRRFVYPTEIVHAKGLAAEKQMIGWSNNIILVLTNFPRLLLIDEKKLILKSQISWRRETQPIFEKVGSCRPSIAPLC